MGLDREQWLMIIGATAVISAALAFVQGWFQIQLAYFVIIILAIVVIILLLWTVFSPDVMPVVGTEYLDPDGFANLGNVTGTRDLWSGNTEWGISVNGSTVVSANQGFDIMLLVTKVSEEPSNFFFRAS